MIRRRLLRWLLAAACIPIANLCASSGDDGIATTEPYESIPGVAVAWADDPVVNQKAIARTLFDEAKKLEQAGKWAEACPKYEESQRLDAGLGTKFYLGSCYEHIGRLASAWLLYTEVADEATELNMKEREEYARKRAENLAPKLTKMKISLSDAVQKIPGIEVRRDGAVVAAGQWGVAVPVDPGQHTVTVGAPSKRSWTTSVEASGEGAVISISVPDLNDDVTVTTSAAPSASAAPTVAPGPDAAGMSTMRKAAVGLGAAGVVGLVVGGVFGGLAADKAGASNQLCTPGATSGTFQCSADGIRLRGEAETLANGANVGLIAGAAFLGTGVVLWLVGPASDTPSKAAGVQPRMAITTSGHGATLQLEGNW